MAKWWNVEVNGRRWPIPADRSVKWMPKVHVYINVVLSMLRETIRTKCVAGSRLETPQSAPQLVTATTGIPLRLF
jgi:hypothetical protein